ncbi:MAG: sulfatase-like hydrolase/transferase [Pseudomonadota bacterium]
MNRRDFLKTTAALTAGASPEALADATQRSREHPQGKHWAPRTLNRRPNILIAIVDDVGYSDFGCYGSELRTSCIDQLAEEGTRFNNFHVTAVCAPTRACLMTGRNAHAVGVGNIAEWGRDLPGYKGWIRQDAATLAEMLKPLDYTTLAIGKWHLSSIDDQNATGPFDRWPNGRGFDRWYGFHGNAMDHFHPELFENTVEVHPEKGADYHLSTDLVDHGIQYLQDHLIAAPQNPFFMYIAFGACHFPLHAPPAYIDRHRGKYGKGWEALRRSRYAQQQALGLLPSHASLAPSNPNVGRWEALSPDERRIAERGQEVYAAMLEHTDDQLKRIIDFLREEDQLDDTIVLVLSDNGAAVSSQPLGTLDLRRSAYLDKETPAHLSAHLDAFGTEDSQCMYGPGWAQASNTPLRWYKGDTHGGGTRSPLVMRWPNGNVPADRIVGQYHHVIDVVPSLLEMINAMPPDRVNDAAALPLQGSSFAYTFDHPDAATNKTVQYFETSGDRAIWVDGWKAVVKHQFGESFENDVWELFHVDHDFCELNDLSKTHPDRLDALVKKWYDEAQRYDVLPMSDDLLGMYKAVVPAPRARHVFYPSMTRLDRLSAPDIFNFDSTLIADVSLTSDQTSGVLLASGDGSIGYEWFLQQGFVYFVYVYTRERVVTYRWPTRIGKGDHLIGLQLHKTSTHAASAKAIVDGAEVGQFELPSMWPIWAPNSGIRCGENRGAPISKAYDGDLIFEGTLNRVIVDIGLNG